MKDISLVTLCMFTVGVMLWLSYGIAIHAAPVIVWNSLSLCLYVAQIALKLTLSARGATILAHFRLPARSSA